MFCVTADLVTNNVQRRWLLMELLANLRCLQDVLDLTLLVSKVLQRDADAVARKLSVLCHTLQWHNQEFCMGSRSQRRDKDANGVEGKGVCGEGISSPAD